MVLQPEQVTLITTAFYAVYGTGLVWMVVMAILLMMNMGMVARYIILNYMTILIKLL